MFKSIKLYKGERVDLERMMPQLADFGYKRVDSVQEEGDFARRGEVIDIYPYTFELPVRISIDIDNVSSLKTFNPVNGQPLWEHPMLIILPFKKTRHTRTSAFTEEFPLSNFLDIQAGDYVVHNSYGIGKFLGIKSLKVKDRPRDHLVLEYDRQEKLYVPVESMHLVQKYLAFQVRRPKLSRLNSKEWLRTKERARKGIQKLAWELLSLEAMRKSIQGFAYSRDTQWQKEFEDTFTFEETPDQIKAVEEVKRDMESGLLMDRLLCGDVGYGKTEVAMRAAFKTIMDNRQVAYLVPTTILAEQHYHNFSQRLKGFAASVEMLSRFKTRQQQKEIIEGVKKGTVDVVIGTHRLLSDDIQFKNLGLVIIDEEQRFGVRAKQKLKELRISTNVLTLTATPIPRTLYMAVMGAKEMSVINTPPQNRLPIKTVVVEYDEDLIRQAMERELKRKGQVYFIHNRVNDIEKVRERVGKLLPEGTRVAVAHGQMPSWELEKVMISFLNGEIDVLFCTMIIESGIDIPNVNTLIVHNAHMFGLSDLHQLRGRVGRFNRSAYAYFMIPKGQVIDTDARKRLVAIEEFSHLGAGFNIAMEDLEIRGAGNLLGIQQHGYINAVGFDLYCRLLKEAIGQFKITLESESHEIQHPSFNN